MAKFYTELNEFSQQFIAEQKMFFTATAPVKGRINVSPKGIDTFRSLDDKTVAYLDLTGSGNETAAHLFQNGRLTIMFCSFTDKPLILRLYGQGRVILPRHEEWDKVYAHFTPTAGERQIIVLDIQSVQTSCGFGVPLYDFKAERKTLLEGAEKKGRQGTVEYQRKMNQESIDGLPTMLFEGEMEG